MDQIDRIKQKAAQLGLDAGNIDDIAKELKIKKFDASKHLNILENVLDKEIHNRENTSKDEIENLYSNNETSNYPSNRNGNNVNQERNNTIPNEGVNNNNLPNNEGQNNNGTEGNIPTNEGLNNNGTEGNIPTNDNLNNNNNNNNVPLNEEVNNNNEISNNIDSENRNETNSEVENKDANDNKSAKEKNREDVSNFIDDRGTDMIENLGVPRPLAQAAVKSNGGKFSPTNTPLTNKISKNTRNKIADNIFDVKNKLAGNKENSEDKNQEKNDLKKEVTNNAKNEVKKEATKKVKSAVVQFIAKNPWVLLIVGGILLLLLIIFMVMGISPGEDDSNTFGYLDPVCNFNNTMINLNTCNTTITSRISIDDYVIGTTYTLMNGQNLSDEAIKTLMIINKTNGLGIGNYDNTTKELNMNDCNVFYQNVTDIDIDTYTRLKGLYDEISDYLFISKEYTRPITTLSIMDTLPFDMNTFNNISNSNKSYEGILNDVYSGLDRSLYSVKTYCTYYTVTDNNSFWWPIGSSEPTGENIYGGAPTSTTISSPYGPRELGNSKHEGIDIAAPCESSIVIAANSGTVTEVYDSCPSISSGYGDPCGGKLGNHVIIDHGNGVVTKYGHMWNSSITVKVGDTVSQGQMIGLVGSSGSSTGCHLHFGVSVAGSYVNPEDYVSKDNPRPIDLVNFGDIYSTSSNSEAVCKLLRNLGYSANATIGMMTNIQAESNFNPSALGDSGTSYGICQWHNSRWIDLEIFAKGNKYPGLEEQVNFLDYELKYKYRGIYEFLSKPYSAEDMAIYFCEEFERPANPSETCSNRVINYLENNRIFVNQNCS